MSWLDHDDNHDLLLTEFGWHADGGALGDGWMGVYRMLNFVGRDVLPATTDHILEPIHEHQVSVGVAAPTVARVKPAACHGVRCRCGVTIVALEKYVWSIGANRDFPRLAVRCRRAIITFNPNLCPADGNAKLSDASMPCGLPTQKHAVSVSP